MLFSYGMKPKPIHYLSASVGQSMQHLINMANPSTSHLDYRTDVLYVHAHLNSTQLGWASTRQSERCKDPTCAHQAAAQTDYSTATDHPNTNSHQHCTAHNVQMRNRVYMYISDGKQII